MPASLSYKIPGFVMRLSIYEGHDILVCGKEV